MSSNAIAFVAGLGSGYLGAQEKQKDRARQEKLDKVAFDRADRETEQYDKAKRKEQVMADAYRPTEVNQNAAMLGISGKPILYEDAGVANSDFRQARTIAASTGYPFAEPAPVHTFSAGGNSFDTQQGAQAGADAYNAPDARNKRAVVALGSLGDYTGAMQLESGARQGKLADLQLKQAETSQAQDAAFREIAEGVAKQGWSAVPKIYENYKDGNTAKVAEDGKGGAVVSVFNGKGEPVGQKQFASELEFMQSALAKVDPKLWVSMKEKQADKAQTQSNADRAFELQVNADKRADRADARAGAAASRANASPGLRKIEETETILGRKLTGPEREKLAGFGKEDDKGDATFATDLVKEAVKGGTLTAEAAPAARQAILNDIKGGKQMERVRSGLAKAKSQGKMAEAVQELRDRGMNDQAIVELGGEVPKAPPVQKTRPPIAASQGAGMVLAPQVQVNPAIDARAPSRIPDFSLSKAFRSVVPVDEELRKKLNAGL